MPTFDRTKLAPASEARRGGYVLSEATGGAPQAVLIATGSEVSVAMAAQEKLAAAGIRARVVSLPCWDVFEAQSREYRESVIPPSVSARVSIEAGATFGWQKWTGDRGANIGVDRYGSSAPGGTNMKEFGFSAENVAKTVQSLLG
jgi:transketolase